MVELDGIQYSVNTPEENVTNMVDFINNYCAVHEVKNSKGEIISIDINTTNPIYMVLYGIAYLVSAVQRLIYNVGCLFSITSSSERQLLELSTLAGVKRRGASRTTINCTVYASRYTDDNPQQCVITTALTKTIPFEGTNIVFRPAYDITIGVGQARLVTLVADTVGSYNISAGMITSFDTEVPGLRQIVSDASTPGRPQESITDLRARMQNKGSKRTQIDEAIEAIEGLTGVVMCNIFFNPSPSNPVAIGDISVPARKTLLLLQGYNAEVANTYYKYMSSETAAAPVDRLIGGGPQYYITEAAQSIPVYLVSPRIQPVSIQVYIDGQVTTTLANTINDALLGLSTHLLIGESLSSAAVINSLKRQLPELNVQGAYISTDGASYSFQVVPANDTILEIDTDRIDIRGTV